MTPDFEEIIKTYSEHVHDFWSYNKFDQGWSIGDSYNDSIRIHPLIKPYQSLSRKVKLFEIF